MNYRIVKWLNWKDVPDKREELLKEWNIDEAGVTAMFSRDGETSVYLMTLPTCGDDVMAEEKLVGRFLSTLIAHSVEEQPLMPLWKVVFKAY